MNKYIIKYRKYKQKYIITKFWNNLYSNKNFIIKHKLPSYCYGYGMLEAIRNNNIELVKQFLLYTNQINNFMFEYCLICCLEHKNIDLFKLLYKYELGFNTQISWKKSGKNNIVFSM